MGMRQNISGSVAVLLIILAVAGAFVLFNREELAPPGVGLHHHGEEEPQQPLPWSPPVQDGEMDRIRRGLLPLGIAVVFPPVAADKGQGVRVAVVAPGSPAERGGLRAGDLLKSFNGQHMFHPFAVAVALEQVDPEIENEVVIVRGGEEEQLVIVGVKPLPPEERLR